MNSNMRLFLELIANSSGMKRELTESGRAVNKFTSGAKREFESLKKAVGSIQGQIAGIGGTALAVQQMMQSAQLDKSLIQIGQTAGAGAGEVANLRTELFRMGKESGQGIENLKGGFDALVQSGLNMKEAKATLDGINIAMAVTGANSSTLAGGLTVAAQAFQFDLAKPGQALELLDKMTAAGRLGNAELQNLSDIFSRVGVNAASGGMGFDKTLAFIEGLSLIERQPERLATLADSTLRLFTNVKYLADAQRGTGVQFFDAKGARRDPFAVLRDIKTQYDKLGTDKSRAAFIQRAFGKADLDTIKGLRTLLTGNNLTKIQKFETTIGGAGGTLKRDFSDATRNLVDQSGILKNTLREAADVFVQPINETLAMFIQFTRDSKANGGWALSGKDMILGGSAGLLGTMLLARYGSKGIGAVAGKMLGKAGSLGIGVAEGKALQAAAGITPVFVTNWPAGGLPVVGGAGINPTGALTTGGALALYGGPLAIAAGGALASWGLPRASRANGWGTQSASPMERHVMGIGGQNNIKLELNIDGTGRVSSRSDLNTKIDTLPRGSFFDAKLN
jgi:TP901 family phage tail tape measure protein